MRNLAGIFATISIRIALLSCAPALGANLMPGGDFEGDTGGWRTTTAKEIVELADAPSGRHVLKLDCAKAEYYFAVAGPNVPIKPRTLYRIRAKVKRMAGGGYLRIGGAIAGADRKVLRKGSSWTLKTYPIVMTPGQGAGAWVSCEGTFLVKRTEAAFLLTRLILKNGVDTVHVDDVSVEEVARPALPALRLPDAVIWPGRPSRMGMAVNRVDQEAAGLVVETTGARYELDSAGATLVCHQRIPDLRRVVTFRFSPALGALAIVRQDEDLCVLSSTDVALSISGDGLVALGPNRAVSITAISHIVPKHQRIVGDNVMAIDERGGFCLYPEQRLAFSAGPSVLTAVPGDTSQPGWTATLAAQPGKRVALAVFPPKSFPWEQSFKTRLIHSNHYPASDDIRAWSRHGNVLILHQNIYTPGQSSGPYVIKDEIEFRRVIATAHEAGMQVLAYFNPGAYRVRDADKAFELLRGLRAEYGFDSFYFDGLYRGDDWSKSYVFIRRIRELVGDKAIYTHSTLNPPAGQPSPYCPFIDAYSDFLLRGEGQTIKSVDGPYLRYVIGTYNISNSIATLKGDKMEGVSPQEKLAAMLRLHGRARWAYPGLRVERDKLFVDWYFPTLDRMAAEHAAGMAAP